MKTVKKVVAVITFAVGLLAWHTNAYAACTTHFVYGPNGQVITCITCCSGSMCHSNCN